MKVATMNRIGWVILLAAATGGCQRGERAPAAAPTAPEAVAATDNHATAVADAPPPKALTGPELYARHCAACHGDRGDGLGIAARFLFPKPRNLATGSFRLISSANAVPSPEDIEAVLVRGMPGSAMPPWPHLQPAERKLLVAEVLRLRREGLREDFIRDAKEQGEEQIDEAELEDFVKGRMESGPVLEVPEIGPASAEVIAAGKALYVKQACSSCHGNEGRGDGQQQMVDSEGFPTRPRDLTRGIYKGSPEPASFYRRLALGMPGTPMPASPNLKPDEIIALVHFLRSLSTDAQKESAVLKRERILAHYAKQLPRDVVSPQWADATPVSLQMTPLWWRNMDSALSVQALHDGQSLALRLSWADDTANFDAARTEAFRDAVAVELFRGAVEPFLGMGAADAPLDIWFWQAEPASGPPTLEQAYPRTTVDVYPLSETSVATAEYDRPGTKRENQPELALPAEASGNPVVPTGQRPAGSSLTADGPGSITFRLPKSRLVTARGQWQAGRWTVMLTRPLSVAADAGVSLSPGEQVSAAFAVWDGAYHDRNGQKSFAIWQDLVLEKPPVAK